MRLFIIITVGLSTSWLQADSLFLQNGQQVEGAFLGGDSRTVRFAGGDQVHTYSLAEIKSLVFEGGPSAPGAGASASGTLLLVPGSPLPTIPAGTQIAVRLIDAVYSKKDTLGQTYRAGLARPLTIGTQTLVPIGSNVTLSLDVHPLIRPKWNTNSDEERKKKCQSES